MIINIITDIEITTDSIVPDATITTAEAKTEHMKDHIEIESELNRELTETTTKSELVSEKCNNAIKECKFLYFYNPFDQFFDSSTKSINL